MFSQFCYGTIDLHSLSKKTIENATRFVDSLLAGLHLILNSGRGDMSSLATYSI